MTVGSTIVIHRNPINDTPDGMILLGNVFFTKFGCAFIWPDNDVQETGDVVWHIGKQWYADIRGRDVDSSSITGYPSIPKKASPVLLVESDLEI